MSGSKALWIQTGYELFALHGESHLKVDHLARRAGVSKSSFYHYFEDSKWFLEALCRHHVIRCHELAERERLANSIDPELITILIEYKTDLLFNRQLRLHPDDLLFQRTLSEVNHAIGSEMLALWARDINWTRDLDALAGIFEMATQNFYTQLSPANLNEAWLRAYFSQLRTIARRVDMPG